MNEMKKNLAERSAEKAMKTIDHILEESSGPLDGDELDMLKDCWKIIHMAHMCCNGTLWK